MIIPFTMVSAVVPSLLLIWYFHSRDVNPEPARVMWLTFGLGVLTVVPVLMVALPVSYAIGGIEDPYARGLAEAFLTAAVPEELFKFLVITLYCARHREFDEPMDGVVYGATASLGFATLENVLYVANGGSGTAIMRAFTAVPCHAFMGAIMGYYVGQARFAPAGRAGLLATGYLAAMVLHGLYDFPLLTLKALAATNHGTIAQDDMGPAAALMALTLAMLVIESVWAVRLARRLRAQQRQQQQLAATTPPAYAGYGAPPTYAGYGAPHAAPPTGAPAPHAPWPAHPGAAPAPWGAPAHAPWGAGSGAPHPSAWGAAAPPAPAAGPLAWVMLVLGGLLASVGGLFVLALTAAVVLGTPGAEDTATIALGGVILGVLPLGAGLLLFALGLKRVAARPALAAQRAYAPPMG